MSESFQPLVSVIIPSFNHVRFIEEAIGSVFRQTYPEIELIVIDDDSTDGSADKIAAIVDTPGFRSRFQDRVIVQFFSRNKGAHHALNEGLSLASGDYVAILNSDDCYHPLRLERQLEKLFPHDRMGFCFSKVRFIDSEGEDISALSPFPCYLSIAQDNIQIFPSVGFALLKQQIAISTGNFLGSRRLFERVGFFSDLKYCHDWDYILRCLCLVEPVYIDQPLYDYRLHGKNSFQTLASVAASETERVIQGYFDAVRINHMENPVAPSPLNWPGVFELFIRRFGFWKWWLPET